MKPPAGFRDPRTVLFAAGAAVVVGLLTGLAPVLQAGRADLTADLKAGAREGTYRPIDARASRCSCCKARCRSCCSSARGCSCAACATCEYVRLGYDVDPVLLVDLNMRGVKLDSAQAVALRQTSAATRRRRFRASRTRASQSRSRSGARGASAFTSPGIDTVGRLGQFNLNAVSPDYFATLGTRIIRGRGITAQDVAARAARDGGERSDGEGALAGQGSRSASASASNADTMPCTYVVGVAENIKSQSLGGRFRVLLLPAGRAVPAASGGPVRAHARRCDEGDARPFGAGCSARCRARRT